MEKEYHERDTMTTFIDAVSDLAAVVRGRRNRLEWSQAQLAEKAGVGRGFIIDLESDKKTVQMDKVFQVCVALDIELMAKQRLQKNRVLVPAKFMGRL
jgi:y4mF family transcriptional regulator